MDVKTLTINVTQEHIDKGVPGSTCYCPIALALKEYPEVTDVAVAEISICVNINSKPYKFVNRGPNSLYAFISRFDARLPVDPFTKTIVFDYDGVDDWSIS